ncbi:MAG: ACT domain-containing protein [Ruminococcaceae bacterium]|nr:ACT domain-containing protein [Oscillospiraceae bacterium]
MRAIVSVIGKDRVGIIASVCGLLAEADVNILDISQTVLQEYFTMVMLVDTAACKMSFSELGDTLKTRGEETGLSIRIQREDIFQAMHRI